MSKFDEAYTVALEERLANLRIRLVKLEAVREAANLYLRTGRGDLEDALAACDDGEPEPDGPTAYDVAKDKARRGQ